MAVVGRPEDIDEDVIKIAFQMPEVDQPAALEYSSASLATVLT